MPGAGAVSLVLSVGDRPLSLDLPRWQVDVRSVRGAEEATAALADERVDCVVADFDLPERDGIDLCADVRERNPDLPFFLVVDDREVLRDRTVDAVEADVTSVVEPDTPIGRDVADAVERYEDSRERARDQELFRSLLRRIPVSVYVKDERGAMVAVAEAMLPDGSDDYIQNDEDAILQHAEDLVGKTDFDIFPREFAEQTVADDRSVMDDGEPIVDKIEEVRNPFGETLYYSTSKAPRYDDGDIVGLVGASLDVTERVVSRRELERQNEQLDEFASILTHDLRNPLSVAFGYLDTLAERYDDEDIDEVRASLERMDALIDELLAFAREGQTVVDFESVDLAAVAREAWGNVETGDATLDVRTELPVEADGERMLRLFENLFRNSVEHGTPAGDEDRAVAAAERGAGAAAGGAADRTGELTVWVADDGPDFCVGDDGTGFGDADLEAVFDRGVTTDPTGTGYGLGIVRNIANAHGWSVEAAEGEAGGARFEFSGVVRTERFDPPGE